jgi:hypothetical protein
MKYYYMLFIPYYVSLRIYKIRESSRIELYDIYHFIDRNFLVYHLPGLFSILFYKLMEISSNNLNIYPYIIVKMLMLYIIANLLLYLIYEIGYIVNEYMAYYEDITYRSLKLSYRKFNKISLILLVASRIIYFILAIYVISFFVYWSVLSRMIYMYTILLITFMIHNIIPVEWRMRSSYPILKTLKSLSVLYPLAFNDFSKIFIIAFSLSLGVIENVYYVLKKHRMLNMWKESYELRFINMILFVFLGQWFIYYLIFDKIDLIPIGYLTTGIIIYYFLLKAFLVAVRYIIKEIRIKK